MEPALTLAMPYAKANSSFIKKFFSGKRPIPRRNAEKIRASPTHNDGYERLHLSRRPIFSGNARLSTIDDFTASTRMANLTFE